MREMNGDCFHVCSLLFLGGFFVHKAFCNIGKGAVCFLFFTYCVTKQFCGFVMSHAFSQCNQAAIRSEEHTSELQSLMRISYAVFCLKKKTEKKNEKCMKLTCTKDLTQRH